MAADLPGAPSGTGSAAEAARRAATEPRSAGSRILGPRTRAILPGLGLSFVLAVVADLIRRATGIAALNPVVVALALGILLRALLPLPGQLKPGISFSVRPLLRAAIVLLGLQITLKQLIDIGPGALVLALAAVATTLAATIALGRWLRVEPVLASLIGTGTAICGASAIVAANQVVHGRDEDVVYALAVITLCGTAAMLIDPVLAAPLGLDARAYGLWTGTSVHEVIQAVGAAAAGGPVATEVGTIAKLARVALLAPALLALGAFASRSLGTGPAGRAKVPIPWFAVGFLVASLVASSGLIPKPALDASRFVTPLMLGASVAALGLSTDLRAIRDRGARPLLLGILSSVFIAALALAGVKLLG
jgi:uncharacterized integral membrane protein (TIGR00698 family)